MTALREAYRLEYEQLRAIGCSESFARRQAAHAEGLQRDLLGHKLCPRETVLQVAPPEFKDWLARSRQWAQRRLGLDGSYLTGRNHLAIKLRDLVWAALLEQVGVCLLGREMEVNYKSIQSAMLRMRREDRDAARQFGRRLKRAAA